MEKRDSDALPDLLTRLVRLTQNVLNTLESHRDRFEILGQAHLAQRFRSRHSIHNIVGIRRQYCVHCVVLESLDLAEIELQSLAEEITNRGSEINLRRKFLLRRRSPL